MEPVEQIEVPDAARTLVTLPRIDYADAFRVDSRRAGRHSGEEWARMILEGASEPTQASLHRGWTMLGLKVRPRGEAGAVLGWRVERSGDDFALLALDSRVGMPARLLFRPEGDTFLFGSFIQFRNPLMRVVWAPVMRPHRRVVSRRLAGAERRFRAAA
jgi:hypothetical protein